MGLRFLFHLFISGFHSDPNWCGVFYFIAQALLQLPAVLLPQGQDYRCEPHTWLTRRLYRSFPLPVSRCLRALYLSSLHSLSTEATSWESAILRGGASCFQFRSFQFKLRVSKPSCLVPSQPGWQGVIRYNLSDVLWDRVVECRKSWDPREEESARPQRHSDIPYVQSLVLMRLSSAEFLFESGVCLEIKSLVHSRVP